MLGGNPAHLLKWNTSRNNETKRHQNKRPFTGLAEEVVSFCPRLQLSLEWYRAAASRTGRWAASRQLPP